MAEGTNATVLMQAVDSAYFKAVADVFDRMVKDIDSGKPLPAARITMGERLDNVRTVHAEMRQRAEDIG